MKSEHTHFHYPATPLSGSWSPTPPLLPVKIVPAGKDCAWNSWEQKRKNPSSHS